MNPGSYEGETVVVTGCASGIGREVAREVAELGARVIGLDVNEPTVEVDDYVPVDLEHKGVPADLIPSLEELGRRYDTRHHNEPGDSPNARLVDELALTGYLTDRYAVVGTPEDCARRVIALKEQGVDRLLFTIPASDPARTLNLWKERVAPLLVGADREDG